MSLGEPDDVDCGWPREGGCVMDLTTHEGGREFVQRLYARAAQVVKLTGGHPPAAIVFAREFQGQSFSSPTPIGICAEHAFTSEEEKTGFHVLIQHAVRSSQASGVVVFFEARMASLPSDTDLSRGVPCPADVPGCRDVLAFLLQTRTRTSLFVASHAGATLGPLEEPVASDALGFGFGAYANFFDRKTAEA